MKWRHHATGAWGFVSEVYENFSNDDAVSMGAGLAYFTLFSIVPILIIIITAGGVFLNEVTVQTEVFRQVEVVLGQNVTDQIKTFFVNAEQSQFRGTVTIGGIIALLFAATGTISVLKSSLNRIFKVKSSPKNGVVHFFLSRLKSLAVILLLGIMILTTVVVNSVIAAFGFYLGGIIPFFDSQILQAVNFLTWLAILTLLFSMLLKWLPDAKTGWIEVILGGFLTALLFVPGKMFLQYSIMSSAYSDIYGAAGSLIIILVWIYYSAQILFIGAEFTYVYSVRHGKKMRPSSDAVAIVIREKAHRR